MRSLSILVLAVLAAGCAPTLYEKADGTAGSQQDFTQCEYEARRTMAMVPASIVMAYELRSQMDLCLRSKGYRVHG